MTAGWGDAGRTADSYLLRDGQWSQLGSLPRGIVGGCQVEIANKIVFIGKEDNNKVLDVDARLLFTGGYSTCVATLVKSLSWTSSKKPGSLSLI